MQHKLTFHEAVPVMDRLRAKAKSPGSRPWYELLQGADWSHGFQKFMEKTRIIDRKCDHYLEVVVDRAAGTVIHYCSEPLSQHRHH